MHGQHILALDKSHHITRISSHILALDKSHHIPRSTSHILALDKSHHIPHSTSHILAPDKSNQITSFTSHHIFSHWTTHITPYNITPYHTTTSHLLADAPRCLCTHPAQHCVQCFPGRVQSEQQHKLLPPFHAIICREIPPVPTGSGAPHLSATLLTCPPSHPSPH